MHVLETNDSVYQGTDLVRSRRWINLNALVPLMVLLSFAWLFLTMPEQRFINWLAAIERWGTWLAYLDGLLMWSACAALTMALSNERRPVIWCSGIVFTLVALAANLLDYFVTLKFSPDLALELSPIWNNIVHVYGLRFALLFGFVGKVFLSVLAGLCFTFFLKYNQVLLPLRRQPLSAFVSHMGERNRTRSRRLLGLATVFAFYFACMNLFCFYVAYANSLVRNIELLSKLPTLPAAVVISLMIVTLAFFMTMFIGNTKLPGVSPVDHDDLAGHLPALDG